MNWKDWMQLFIFGACIMLLAVGLIKLVEPEKSKSPPPIKEVVFKGHTYIQFEYPIPWLHAAHCPCMAKVTVKWGTNTIGEVDDYRGKK